MNFEQVLTHFQIASRNGSSVQARCPAHDDRKASLSIDCGEDGRTLIDCHATCTTKAVVAAAGLTMSDLFVNNGNGSKPKREIVATYDYVDAAGKLLYQAVRYTPKDFRQRRPDGNGGFIWNLKNVDRILYRLPEILEAVRAGKRVFVVEGEKDSNNLWGLGLVATTKAGGAAAKWLPEYSETLRGARVTILPDNDAPGRKAADVTAESLHGVAAEVKILALPGLTKEHEDVTNWIERGGTAEELERLADAAPVWEPKPEPETVAVSGNLTDLYHARKIVEHHGADIRFCRKLGGFYIWTGKHWAADETGQIWRWATATAERIYHEAQNILNDDERSRVREFAARAEKRQNIENALRHLECQEGVAVTPEVFDKGQWLLNVASGTLDLRFGRLREHKREDMITRCSPVEYHADAECWRWLQFLAEITDGNYRLMDFLQRVCGYALTGSVREQKLFFLYGTGANGKSTFLDTLLFVLGDYARRIAPDLLFLNRDDSHPTALADLHGKRLAVTTEVEQGKRFAEVLVKELSGGDRVTARRMRQDYFEFAPTHKIFLSGNHMPIIRGTDHAIWRRIDLIPFTVTIADDKQDKDLPGKLRAEAPGILSWAVQGCLEWQRKGLGEPEEVTAATRAYRSDMDILGDFLSDCCIITPGAEVPNPDLRKAYEAWCEENGERSISSRAFGLRLKERGLVQVQAGSARTRTWKGIGLLNG